MGKTTYAFVMSAMNKTGFDFFGELAGQTATGIVLRNPVVLQYNDDRMFSGLAPMHLPLGCIDMTKISSEITLPLDGIAYSVKFEEDDNAKYAPIVKMYKGVFSDEQAA